MSSSSSSDLETSIINQITIEKSNSTKRKKPKNKNKPTAVRAPGHQGEKNEGDNPHWAYEPPAGAVLLDHSVDSGPFDWDAIHDDSDVELWLVRVPDSIKSKHLDGLEIDAPSSASRTARVGSLARKHATYDVWSVGTGPDSTEAAPVGVEELGSLSCLLPRKRKSGKLYLAPKPVSRLVVVSAQSLKPTLPAQDPGPIAYHNPPRASYPKDALKHRFVPYGARRTQDSEDASMDVDAVETLAKKPVEAPSSPPKDGSIKTKKSKGKKRKVEGDSPKPKKSKKHKSHA